MKNFLFLFLLITYLLISTKSSTSQNPIEIDEDYINNNFENLSKKENLIQSFTKIANSGNFTLLDTFLSKLKENKIDFSLLVTGSSPFIL